MADDLISNDVHQLCLRLKPILGFKVDQIYKAYLAEDSDGKKQIEQYLQLLLSKYMPTKLGQSETILLPPSREKAAGEYQIGTVTYADRELYPFGLREDEWIRHIAILGQSGVGKTNLSFNLIRELKNKQKPFIIFDWKRNYRDLLNLPGFQDVKVYTVGRDVAPFSFNPLIPPAGTDPKIWLKMLNEIIAHSYCLGNGVLFLLQQAVDTVYEEAGVYDGTVEKFPTLKDVLSTVRKLDVRGRELGWLSSTLRALSSLCFGDMDKLLNTDNNRSIDNIFDKYVILELDALNQSSKTFVVQTVMLYLHHKLLSQGQREEFSRCVILEEAHHVLSQERKSLIGGESCLDVIFREIRELGVSMVLIDQHPSRLSLPSLGNSYMTVCLGQKHKSDINAIAQCMLLDNEKDILSSLDVGQAVVKLQGRIARPFQIKIPEFLIEKGKISDFFVKEHMRDITCGAVENDLAFEIVSAPPNPKSVEFQGKEIAFLKDIQEFPDGGIAVRYKRIGLSVRQGQKLKAKFLEKGIIVEHNKTTKTGRLTSIQLTERGQQMLQDLYSAA